MYAGDAAIVQKSMCCAGGAARVCRRCCRGAVDAARMCAGNAAVGAVDAARMCAGNAAMYAGYAAEDVQAMLQRMCRRCCRGCAGDAAEDVQAMLQKCGYSVFAVKG